MSVKMKSEGPPDDEPVTEEGHLAYIKKQRAGFKSVVTRRRNQARALLLSESNAHKIKQLLPSMKDAWSRFEESHHEIVNKLTGQDEIAEAERYYIDELDSEEQIMDRISKWIETADMQEAYDNIPESASKSGSKSTRSGKSGSSTRQKKIEAMANRKALEAKFKVLEESQILIESDG